MAVLTPAAPPAEAPPGAPRQKRHRPRERWTPYLLLAPAGILLTVFLVYPIGSVVYYSLYKYNVTKPWDNGFVGLGNYAEMLRDDLFWQSLVFTGQWVVVEVSLQLVFGLALALVINESFVGRAISRALVFSPWAVSGVLTTTIWLLIYNPTTGFGRYLADAGVGEYGTSLLTEPGTAFWAAVLAGSGGASRSSRSSSSPTCSRSPATCTRRPRSTAPAGSAGSGRSRCRTCATRSSCPPCCGRSGSSTTSTCSTPSPAAARATPP